MDAVLFDDVYPANAAKCNRAAEREAVSLGSLAKAFRKEKSRQWHDGSDVQQDKQPEKPQRWNSSVNPYARI